MINLIKINASQMTSRPAGYHSHQMTKSSTEHLYSALYLHLFLFPFFFFSFSNQPLIAKDSSYIEKRQCLHLAIDFCEMYLGVFYIVEPAWGGFRAGRLVTVQAHFIC